MFVKNLAIGLNFRFSSFVQFLFYWLHFLGPHLIFLSISSTPDSLKLVPITSYASWSASAPYFPIKLSVYFPVNLFQSA